MTLVIFDTLITHVTYLLTYCDRSINYTRVFTEMGESLVETIVKTPNEVCLSLFSCACTMTATRYTMTATAIKTFKKTDGVLLRNF